MTFNLLCTRCGLPEAEHGYDRCAWGICKGFISPISSIALNELCSRFENANLRYSGGKTTVDISLEDRLALIALIRTVNTEVVISTTPPKPTPDAMREAILELELVHSRMPYSDQHDRELRNRLYGALLSLRILSAHVPPADGVRTNLSGTDFMTGSEAANVLAGIKEHHVLLSPSPTVAAESGKQILDYARRLNDIATTCEIEGMKGHTSDLRRIARQIATSPPIREARTTFYTILTHYIPQQSIDQAWQELREAGLIQ